MKEIVFPPSWRIEALRRDHPRQQFRSGDESVDQWLATQALQNLEKSLSTTNVLLDETDSIAGYYTLATGQVDFSDLPKSLTKGLPRRGLPVAVLAWLGVSAAIQGPGIGSRLLAHALRQCHLASQTFAFVAVILDSINDRAKRFYQTFDFEELPGYPYRLFLSAKQLETLMQANEER